MSDEQRSGPDKIGQITKTARQQIKKARQQKKKIEKTGEEISDDVRKYWNTPLSEKAIETELTKFMSLVTDAASLGRTSVKIAEIPLGLFDHNGRVLIPHWNDFAKRDVDDGSYKRSSFYLACPQRLKDWFDYRAGRPPKERFQISIGHGGYRGADHLPHTAIITLQWKVPED